MDVIKCLSIHRSIARIVLGNCCIGDDGPRDSRRTSILGVCLFASFGFAYIVFHTLFNFVSFFKLLLKFFETHARGLFLGFYVTGYYGKRYMPLLPCVGQLMCAVFVALSLTVFLPHLRYYAFCVP